MASFTPSGAWIPTSPVIDGVGFPLGTRLQTFYLDPRHPNALVPGKRPRTTLTPTLVTRDGAPAMVLGTQGGDQQDQWTLQVFLNQVVFGMEVQDAIEAAALLVGALPVELLSRTTPRPAACEWRDGCRTPSATSSPGAATSVTVEDDWVAGDVLCIRVDDGADVLHGGADPRGEISRRMPSYAIGW